MSHTFGEPYNMNDEQRADVRRKRLLSASDEDIEATMDAKQLPYRRGWPELQPLPLTNVSHFLDKVLSPMQRIDILDRARTVFRAQRLSTDSLRLVFRVPEHVDIDGSVNLGPYLTLLWAADFLQDSPRLNRCIVQIRQSLLRVVEYQNIAIECLHLTCIHRPPTYGIVLSDGAVKAKASEMMDYVVEQLGAKGCSWLCVEVARRGLIPEYFNCPPTILITTPDASNSRWYQQFLPGIRNHFLTHAPAFKIEIVQAQTIFCARKKHPASRLIGDGAYEKTVWMGSSVGIESETDCGGTLGGLVVLTGGGQPETQCALTNWHVVRDNRLDKALSPKSGALEPKHPTLAAKPQVMTSPSTQDQRGHLVRLQEEMQGFKDRNKLDYWNDTKQKVTDICQKDRRIGHVYAGSGFRHVDSPRMSTDPNTGKERKDSSKVILRFSLDWALVAVANPTGRVVMNVLPEAPRPPLQAMKQGRVCNNWSTFDVRRDTVRVAKLGRTSGWTTGEIASELIRLNPVTTNGEFAVISKNYGFTVENPGFCFQVTKDSAEGWFIQPGDAGSILMHESTGTWLGLCFGQTGADHGMFIPIDLVFRDIKKVTGRDVLTPSFVKPETVGLHSGQA